MSLPLAVQEPAFWARYTFAVEDGPGADRLGDLEVPDDFDLDADNEVEVRFAAGAGHFLVLSADASLDSYDLGVLVPGASEPAQLGWDDLGHWHPFALRWDEFALLCPGAEARALLCRFVAVFEDDDVNAAVATVDAAYQALRPAGWDGYWPTGADWLSRADHRGRGIRWHHDEAGHRWADEAEEFYSTRTVPPGDDGFPHEQLKALLDSVS